MTSGLAMVVNMKRAEAGSTRSPVGPGFYFASAILFSAAVAATIYSYGSMSGVMAMPGGWSMSMIWMRMPGQSWLAAAAMFVWMWLAMMVVMMLPSALPMFTAFHRSAVARGIGLAGIKTAMVVSGYFAVWTAIGIVAYAAGIVATQAAMKWTKLSLAAPALAGVALVLAGLFQWSRWKKAGLSRCRAFDVCAMPETHGNPWTAMRRGFREGIDCGICCSGLMIVMLVLGAMNPVVMIAVAIVIALEKFASKPQPVVRLTGLLVILTGIGLILRSLLSTTG